MKDARRESNADAIARPSDAYQTVIATPAAAVVDASCPYCRVVAVTLARKAAA